MKQNKPVTHVLSTERKLFADLPLSERIRLAREHINRPDTDYINK